jgi:hypothetical protein
LDAKIQIRLNKMFTAFCSILLLLLGLIISGAIPVLYPGSFYWFSIPFLIHATASTFLSAKCHFRPSPLLKKKRNGAFWCLPVTAMFPMFLWPGGDDGPGMAWMFIVGGGSIIIVLISIFGSFLIKVLNRDTANIHLREK